MALFQRSIRNIVNLEEVGLKTISCEGKVPIMCVIFVDLEHVLSNKYVSR